MFRNLSTFIFVLFLTFNFIACSGSEAELCTELDCLVDAEISQNPAPSLSNYTGPVGTGSGDALADSIALFLESTLIIYDRPQIQPDIISENLAQADYDLGLSCFLEGNFNISGSILMIYQEGNHLHNITDDGTVSMDNCSSSRFASEHNSPVSGNFDFERDGIETGVEYIIDQDSEYNSGRITYYNGLLGGYGCVMSLHNANHTYTNEENPETGEFHYSVGFKGIVEFRCGEENITCDWDTHVSGEPLLFADIINALYEDCLHD